MKKPWRLCVFCLAAAALLLWQTVAPSFAPSAPTQRRFCFLSDYATGLFISQVKQGAKVAADEQGDKLVSENLEISPVDQLRRLKDTGVLGVVYLCQEEANANAIEAACESLHMYMVKVGPGGDGYSVWNDEFRAGAQLAQAGMALDPTQILLLSEPGSLGEERLSGALGALADKKKTVLPYDLKMPEAEPGAQPLIKSGACVLALGQKATDRAAGLKRSGVLGDALVLGISGQRQGATSLEEGYFHGLLYPSPYAIGYLALHGLQNQALGHRQEKQRHVPYTLITLDNLYDSRNVKLAFPLLK